MKSTGDGRIRAREREGWEIVNPRSTGRKVQASDLRHASRARAPSMATLDARTVMSDELSRLCAMILGLPWDGVPPRLATKEARVLSLPIGAVLNPVSSRIDRW